MDSIAPPQKSVFISAKLTLLELRGKMSLPKNVFLVIVLWLQIPTIKIKNVMTIKQSDIFHLGFYFEGLLRFFGGLLC